MRFATKSAGLGGLVRLMGLLAAGSLACSPTQFQNNTASLGGTTPGQRGNVRVSFVNKTPFRAIFTYGTYDPLDTDTQFHTLTFHQFFVDPNPANRLEGNSESGIITMPCNRVVSLGGAELIQRIKDAHQASALSEEALTPGIAFSDKPLDDPQAGQATAGRAPAVETLQGAAYQCESLLVYTLNVDPAQPSGFRVDLNVILP